MAHNRATELLGQFFKWLNKVRESLEKSERAEKSLVIDHDGGSIVVPIRHETPDGYLCDKQRPFAWYVAWPFCSDFMMNEMWFIRKDDPRILSITDSNAFF